MKRVLKRNLFFLMLLSTMFAGFTACNDDDVAENAEVVSGEYKGSIVVGESDPISDVTISMAVRANYADSITLSFNQIIPPLTVPANVTCPAKVTETAGIYGITGAGNAVIEGFPAPLPVTVTGTVDNAGNSKLTINVTVSEELIIPVTFTGKK